MQNKSVALIPSYKPDARLIEVIQALQKNMQTVVVDDGSGSEFATIFEKLKTLGAVVIRHSVNLGKGRALKTGFDYILQNFPEAKCCVTADADGQHLPDDILNVEQAISSKNRIVIGTRTFEKSVPLRSRLGNQLTRFIFRWLVGTDLRDTQSGLRAIEIDLLPKLLTLTGEKYEYETNMLIFCKNMNIEIKQVDIKTVYVDDNKSSHFNPLRDSMRIYFLFVRFGFSALSTSLIDYLVFFSAYKLTNDIASSIAGARVFAGTYNFYVNKRLVFRSKIKDSGQMMAEYILVVAVFALLSFLLVNFLNQQLGWNVMAAKITAESLLFFASFSIQRDYIFRSGRKRSANED
jgi:glycosyltransferase involved in cell wall biosynthesis